VCKEPRPMNLEVPGKPAPWQAQMRRAERSPGFLRMQAWQDVIRIYARQAMGSREPSAGPIELEFVFYLAWPKSGPKMQGPAGLRYAEKQILKKPDVSNLNKAAEDALKGIIFVDDSQVIKVSGEKTFAYDVPEGWVSIGIEGD